MMDGKEAKSNQLTSETLNPVRDSGDNNSERTDSGSFSGLSDITKSSVGITQGISGYLLKKTREGRWQKRWFETHGSYLTYYKAKKAQKLLAALSLPQVGK